MLAAYFPDIQRKCMTWSIPHTSNTTNPNVSYQDNIVVQLPVHCVQHILAFSLHHPCETSPIY